MEMPLSRRMVVLVAAVLMALLMAIATVAGPASAATVYKGKGNGYGWVKNNGGMFPGGGSDECTLCNPV